MPRRPRLLLSGIPLHIIQRGNKELVWSSIQLTAAGRVIGATGKVRPTL